MASQGFYDDPRNFFAAMNAANPSLPMPTLLPENEVQRLAKQRANSIFADKEALSSIYDRYGGTIHRRWTKKTSEQRRKILLKACPTMPAKHRPDFDALRLESREQRRPGATLHFRDSYLLPSINQEDLIKPNTFLLFLESRCRNSPDAFANADINSIHLAMVAQAIVPSFLNEYTMLLIGQRTPSTYGRLISWDDDESAFDMMSRGVGIQPGEGLLTLEIQQRKLQFIRACVEIILQDLPITDLSIPVDSEHGEHSIVRNSHEDSEWPSLTKETLEAQYRKPDQFDFGRLQSFVLAKRAEAEDHIWFLREDPAYFKETVYDWGEHREERILSVNGNPHPVLRQDLFWDRVLGNVVVNAYTDLLGWDRLSQDVADLVILRERYSDQLSPTSPMPKEYEEALCHFSYLVEQSIKGPLGNFKAGMPSSPPLRAHYVRQPHPNPVVMRVHKDYLIWLLEQFTHDDQVFLCGIENLVDELERILRSDARSRERVSGWTARLISELSLMAELKRQVGLLSPGSPMTEFLSLEDQKEEFSKRMSFMKKTFNVFQKDMALSSVGTPLTKFNYPAEKRQTRSTTRLLQEAERSLDEFWAKIDRHFVKHSGETLHQMISEVFSERVVKRTPDWVEPGETTVSHDPVTKDISTELSSVSLGGLSGNTIDSWKPPSVKTKPKTRGVAATPTTQEPTDLGENSADDESPKFTVSKRGFKVFSTLFHGKVNETLPGEIPWSEFLSAMASVGFSIQKLDGSAWVFEPQDDLFRRSIIFHEPHPSNKIPFTIARRIGRRLERAYGWTSENFVRA